jgi:phosphoserine phosphatase
MMTSVLTLIAAEGLDDNTLSALRQTLAAAGADCAAADWLAPGRAADLVVRGIDRAAIVAVARPHLAGLPVDWLVQAADNRRKMLLIADMDSTIVQTETLDELAAYAGLKDRIAAITARSMKGEIDFKDALRLRVGLLAGLPEASLAATEAATFLTPGAALLVATMRRHGAYTLLVSGGFEYFTERVRRRCGFDADRANHLDIEKGKLTGTVREPILDRDAKLAYLEEFTAARGLSAEQTLAVGDGANDLAMIRKAGLGVAFHAKPILADMAAFRVDHNDLTALLFAQGYRLDEFTL